MAWNLRPATVADYPRLAEIFTSVSTQTATADDLVRQDAVAATSGPALRLVLEEESGLIQAFGRFSVDAWRAAGTYHLQVTVAADAAGQGRGSRLFEALVAEAQGHGARLLTASVRDDRPAFLTWAERRGYRVIQHYFKSELPLADFDPERFRSAVHQAEADGCRFFTLAEVDAADGKRRLYEIDMDAARDEPGIDLTKWPPVTFEEYAAQVFETPGFDPRAVVIAEQDGKWVGFSGLHYRQQENSGWVFFTGVRRAHRGRGLAQALKLLSTEYAKRQGWEKVGTSNNARNPAMLAVNRKLGFRPLPGFYQLEKSL